MLTSSTVQVRLCHEMYGARNADTYHAVMSRAKVCRRPARYRITIPGFAVVHRCGIHARWYRKPENRVERC